MLRGSVPCFLPNVRSLQLANQRINSWYLRSLLFLLMSLILFNVRCSQETVKQHHISVNDTGVLWCSIHHGLPTTTCPEPTQALYRSGKGKIARHRPTTPSPNVPPGPHTHTLHLGQRTIYMDPGVNQCTWTLPIYICNVLPAKKKMGNIWKHVIRHIWSQNRFHTLGCSYPRFFTLHWLTSHEGLFT